MESFTDYLKSQDYLDYLNLVEQHKTEFEKLSKNFFESLVYEDQLKVFFHVIKNVYEGSLLDNGSFRHIIYGKFNFGPDSYALGMDCGLLDLNNSIYSRDEISNCLKAIFKYLNLDLDNTLFEKMVNRFTYGSFGETSIRNRSIQLSLNYDDNI